MRFSRLNVLPLLRDQFRFMRHAVSKKPAWDVRLVVLLIAPLGVAVSLFFGWEMQAVTDLVAALGLLAGVFISAFAVVFSLRVNLEARPTRVLKQNAARLMDESALTMLSAGLLAGVDAIWLSIVSATIAPGGAATAFQTAVAVGLSGLVIVYFLMTIRRLHVLYTDTFPPFWRVEDAVNSKPQRTSTPS